MTQRLEEEFDSEMQSDLLVLKSDSKSLNINKQIMNIIPFSGGDEVFSGQNEAASKVSVTTAVSKSNFSTKFRFVSTGMRQGYPPSFKNSNQGLLQDSHDVLKNMSLAVTKMERSLLMLDDVLKQSMSVCECKSKCDWPLNGRVRRVNADPIMSLLYVALTGAEEDMILLRSYCVELKQLKEHNPTCKC